MQFLIYFSLLAMSFNGFSKNIEKRKPSQMPGIAVTPTDEHFNAEALKTDGVQVRPRNAIPESEQIISPAARNKIFLRAGLLKSVSDWGELEKDILLLRARNYSIDELKAKYPKIDSKYLQKLKDAIN